MRHILERRRPRRLDRRRLACAGRRDAARPAGGTPAFLLALVLALPLFAGTPLPPAPTQWVTDAANVIPDDREAALNAKLQQFERDTNNQLIVYVARRVPENTTLEEMSAEAIRTWAIGDKELDNGAILFLFVDDRQSRIEVGYGHEGALTDARSKQILVNLRAALQSGDYATAAELGATEIIDAIAVPATPVSAYDTQAAIEARAAEIAAREEKLLIPTVIFGLFLFSFIFYALYRVFIVGDWKLGRGGRSSSSGSSSSSSSSSFGGGGGSGGGGGASDRW